MNTKENNKMIAEFMGMQQTDIGWYDNEETLQLRNNTFDELQYHKEWNWLMPVVEKINNILDDDDEFVYSVNIHPSKVTIYYENYDRIFVSNEHGSTTREMLYNAVVEFINQYNKNESTD
tara:strand:- start:12161 stop:12520 length:360 start_codon:yes stop_codon:yes gene_type:complete